MTTPEADRPAPAESVIQRLRGTEEHLSELESQLAHRLTALRHHHRQPRNVNQAFEASFSTLDRIAIFVTDRVGTFGFFLIILAWTILWLGWNLVGPHSLRFDPAPAFVLWLFISNMIQIFLMPLIIVGQNLQGRHSEMRAENDFEINTKAEQEVEVILLRLEQQAALIERQQELILEILRRLDGGAKTEGKSRSSVDRKANS
jgi:uncharacterized membrane protein